MQDHWTDQPHLSADLGARYEHVARESTGDIIGVENQPHRAAPRPSAYDVDGNGDHVVHATYGQYSGRYNEAQIGANSPVGNPADIAADLSGSGRPGRRLRAGLERRRTIRSSRATRRSSVPTANVFIDPNTEVAADARVHRLVRREHQERQAATARRAYVHRTTADLIEDFIRRSTDGFTNVVVERHRRRTGHQPACMQNTDSRIASTRAGVPVAVSHHAALDA